MFSPYSGGSDSLQTQVHAVFAGDLENPKDKNQLVSFGNLVDTLFIINSY